MRVGCWPKPDDYDYLRLFYMALAPYGITVDPEEVPLDAGAMAGKWAAFDAIHVNWPEWQWAAAGSLTSGLKVIRRLSQFLSAARRAGVPIIWTAHNLAGHDRNTLLDRLGFYLFSRRVDAVICHDRSSYERIRARRPADRPTLLIRHGSFSPIWPPPAPRTATRHGLGATVDTRLLLCFGVIRPYKGFDVAAAALELLPPRYRLLIAGRAGDAESAKQLEQKQSDRLRVATGRFTNQELVDMLEACDCVLLPYRAITSSGVLIAALSAGRGVVATRLPLFEDTLAAEPLAGVLCESGPSALARAVEEFFSVPLAERSGAALRLVSSLDWTKDAAPLAAWLTERARRPPGPAAS